MNSFSREFTGPTLNADIKDGLDVDFFPLFARLNEQPCLLVGGGEVAARKLRLLLDAGARVTVNAPMLNEEISAHAAEGRIQWQQGRFDPWLVENALLVIAATDDKAVNAEVAAAGRRWRRLVNVVDDGEQSSFITPAIVDRSPLIVAISTGGSMPVLARWLRQRLESRLPAGLGRLAAAARELRQTVKNRLSSLVQRRRFWESLLEPSTLDGILASRDPQQKMVDGLDEFDDSPRPGRVYLVGAGPGAADLLTLRGLQVLEQADVVLHDQLVSTEIMARIRRDATRIDVGKKAGDHRWQQARINNRLVQLAREGKQVVRLKGGDPFVFGRGGEELQVLKDAGVDFEVVPGITAAVGCGAYAGIPLTHRNLAQQVVFATAHCQDSLDCLDWSGLARPGQTRVFYMPVKQLAEVRVNLVENGLDPNTPFALIENGTRSDQRVVGGTLSQLERIAKREKIISPALLVVGETAALHRDLAWFQTPEKEPEPLPLAVGAWAY